VEIDVYDVAGRHVRTLLEDARAAGTHGVMWDGRTDTGTRVPTGVYFYTLRIDNDVLTRKVMLVR
jgi:flagellar hook assembly protein FlgD